MQHITTTSTTPAATVLKLVSGVIHALVYSHTYMYKKYKEPPSSPAQYYTNIPYVNVLPIELGQLPPTSTLQHLQEIQEDNTINFSQGYPSKQLSGVQIVGGLPPVPQKFSRQNPVWGICRYIRTIARSIACSKPSHDSKQQGSKIKGIRMYLASWNGCNVSVSTSQ